MRRYLSRSVLFSVFPEICAGTSCSFVPSLNSVTGRVSSFCDITFGVCSLGLRLGRLTLPDSHIASLSNTQSWSPPCVHGSCFAVYWGSPRILRNSTAKPCSNFYNIVHGALQVYRILLKATACVQPVSCDEAYLDVTGLGDPEEVVSSIRQHIFEATGCTASAGVGPTMLIARLATKKGKPNGQYRIHPHEVCKSVNQSINLQFVSSGLIRGVNRQRL